MKRLLLTTLLLLLVVSAAAGITYGPDLWNGYKLLTTVERQAQEYEKFIGPWPNAQDGCVLCHGFNGQAKNSQYPSLAGLSADYIRSQLNAFASGDRLSPQMNSVAAGLSVEQINELANFYAEQTPALNEEVPISMSQRVMAEGRIQNMACESCHGVGMGGGSPAGPIIAGQGRFYLREQLLAFKAGLRRDPTQTMNTLAERLTLEEIGALASHLANLSAEPLEP